MGNKNAGVYKFEYEMDNSRWTAYIVAKSNEDASSYLISSIKKPIVIISNGFECRFDDITKTIVDEIVHPYKMKINKLKKDKKALLNAEPATEKKKLGRKPKSKDDGIKIGKS